MKTSELERLNDVIKSFDTAMLVTLSRGQIRSRPMAIAKRFDDGHLWFLTDEASGKMAELDRDDTVNLTMQSGSRYLSISGHARATRDPRIIDVLWKPTNRAWFPEGKSDPHILALEIVPHVAEYWDHSGLKGIRSTLRIGAAMVSREVPEWDEDINYKLDFAGQE